jgi:hypothetical protein
VFSLLASHASPLAERVAILPDPVWYVGLGFFDSFPVMSGSEFEVDALAEASSLLFCGWPSCPKSVGLCFLLLPRGVISHLPGLLAWYRRFFCRALFAYAI